MSEFKILSTDLVHGKGYIPALDVGDNDGNLLIIAEISSFAKDDINVSFDQGMLVIKASIIE